MKLEFMVLLPQSHHQQQYVQSRSTLLLLNLKYHRYQKTLRQRLCVVFERNSLCQLNWVSEASWVLLFQELSIVIHFPNEGGKKERRYQNESRMRVLQEGRQPLLVSTVCSCCSRRECFRLANTVSSLNRDYKRYQRSYQRPVSLFNNCIFWASRLFSSGSQVETL